MKGRSWIVVLAVLVALGVGLVVAQASHDRSANPDSQDTELEMVMGSEAIDDFPCTEGGFVSCLPSEIPPYEPSRISVECEYEEGDFGRAWCSDWGSNSGWGAAGSDSLGTASLPAAVVSPPGDGAGRSAAIDPGPIDDFPCVEGGFVSCQLSQIPPYKSYLPPNNCEYKEGDFNISCLEP